MLELIRGDIYQSLGQFYGRLVGALDEIVVVRELLHLLVNGLDNTFLAVAEVAAPQAGHTV